MPSGPRTERQRELETLVEWLADSRSQPWSYVLSYSDAARRVLEKMAELGMIDHQSHQFGGDVWTVNGKKYGRLD